ncbi:ureidoglycolate lyase [Rhodocyclus tenuis]|uniref:Ureidoglycolate lyase n=1 Tax=Rhodocyclus tenuis TaxID=1066 RepID=A0A840GFL8_RHOTE|nr:ureidoglycolate lyase [Rhodocyclus tenuis]MBB4247332.1 ureidoglycolate lyase [Rhodocyclus tenuis]
MSSDKLQLLPALPLCAKAFAPFGQVIECSGHASYAINAGSSQRFSDLAQLEADTDGRLALSIFRANAQRTPLTLSCLERHPRGSQAFMPLNGQAFVVVVAEQAPGSARQAAESLRVFVSNGCQGINFRSGVWHHPLLSLGAGDFLVADRLGPGPNCEEIDLSSWGLGIAL